MQSTVQYNVTRTLEGHSDVLDVPTQQDAVTRVASY